MNKQKESNTFLAVIIAFLVMYAIFHIVFFDLKLDCTTSNNKIELNSSSKIWELKGKYITYQGWMPNEGYEYEYSGNIIYCDEGVVNWENIKIVENAHPLEKAECIEQITKCESILK